MAGDDDKGSGDSDGIPSHLIPPSSPPAATKVPDVELIVDGFGCMPKYTRSYTSTESSQVFEKSDQAKAPEPPKEEKKKDESPCASCTDIDVVRRYTWKTKNRMLVQVISYGATITTIKVPDRKGTPDDVVAGFDTLEEYFQPRNPYFGATIGRYANLIKDGTCVVKPSGRMYMLSRNRGHDHYHGGFVGFDKVNWRSYVIGNKVIMSHVSEHFNEGYPGEVMAQVSFEVTCDNIIKIEMRCTTSAPTIINLSNSPYFNLAGHHAGCDALYDHIFMINADKYTVAEEDGLVTGEKKVVGGTVYDFRVPRVLRAMLPRVPLGGYDINFCISQGTEQDLTFHARVLHPGSGRVLEVYSNQPGMQFYTGNRLPDPDKIVEPVFNDDHAEEEVEGETASSSGDETSEGTSAKGEGEEVDVSQGKLSFGYVPLTGKQGTLYKKHGLFCTRPQNYPDACNHKNFPNSVLNPGEVYVHRIQYKFGVLLGKYV